MKNSFRVEFTGPMTGRVWLNGTEVNDVVSVKFDGSTGEPATVTLKLYAKTIDIAAPDVAVIDASGPSDDLIAKLPQILADASQETERRIVEGLSRGKF